MKKKQDDGIILQKLKTKGSYPSVNAKMLLSCPGLLRLQLDISNLQFTSEKHNPLFRKFTTPHKYSSGKATRSCLVYRIARQRNLVRNHSCPELGIRKIKLNFHDAWQLWKLAVILQEGNISIPVHFQHKQNVCSMLPSADAGSTKQYLTNCRGQKDSNVKYMNTQVKQEKSWGWQNKKIK